MKRLVTAVVGPVKLKRSTRKRIGTIVLKRANRRCREPLPAASSRRKYSKGKQSRTTDEFVADAMHAVTRPCREFSTRAQRPFRKLEGTVKDTWARHPFLRGRITYRQLLRKLRLSNPRLGISKALIQTDRCDCCYTYDYSFLPMLRQVVAEHHTSLTLIVPTYFDKYEAEHLADAWDFSFSGLVLRLRQYLNLPLAQKLPSALTSHGKALLLEAQGKATAALAELAEEQSGYVLHFQLRDYLAQQLVRDQLHADEDTMTLLFDYQEKVA